MFRKIVFILYFALFIHAYSYAFQFEDYSWGKSIEEAKELLRKSNKAIVYTGSDKISYRDTISGEPSQVSLLFTSKSQLLFMIQVVFDKYSAAEKVKDTLTKIHGQPMKESSDLDRYIWSDDSGCVIGLSYGQGQAELIYSAGDSSQDGAKVAPAADFFR